MKNYRIWLAEMHRHLKRHRPDVDPKLLDPNSTMVAFRAGESPISFVLRGQFALLQRTVAAVQPSKRKGFSTGLILVGFLAMVAGYYALRRQWAIQDGERAVQLFKQHYMSLNPELSDAAKESIWAEVQIQYVHEYTSGLVALAHLPSVSWALGGTPSLESEEERLRVFEIGASYDPDMVVRLTSIHLKGPEPKSGMRNISRDHIIDAERTCLILGSAGTLVILAAAAALRPKS